MVSCIIRILLHICKGRLFFYISHLCVLSRKELLNNTERKNKQTEIYPIITRLITEPGSGRGGHSPTEFDGIPCGAGERQRKERVRRFMAHGFPRDSHYPPCGLVR